MLRGGGKTIINKKNDKSFAEQIHVLFVAFLDKLNRDEHDFAFDVSGLIFHDPNEEKKTWNVIHITQSTSSCLPDICVFESMSQ